MTRILFKFIIYPSCERALKNGRVKSKIARKSSLNFTSGQGSCLISDFARPNSNKAVLVQVFLKSDSHVPENFCQIKIFPSHFRKNTMICLFGV